MRAPSTSATRSPAPTTAVLVLSNSLGSTSAMWDPQVPRLAERLRVVRYDHRGHGGSPVPPGPYSLDDLGADAVALLDRLGLERVHWCGLSLGGMVGMWMAINAPERIDRLVLCCTSAQLGPPEMWARARRDRARRGRRGDRRRRHRALADRGLHRARATAPPRRCGPCSPRRPTRATPACCAAIEHMDLVPELGAIRAPTLVIAGRQDPATPPEHGERIAAGIRGARLELVDAAHLATIEQPDVMTDLIAGHLAA